MFQPGGSGRRHRIEYRNEPLLEDSGTPPAVFDAPDPGESQLEERSFENAPPVIPHNVDGLLPITGERELLHRLPPSRRCC